MPEIKNAARPTVVRVRGLPRTDLLTAEATVRKAIADNSPGQSLNYSVSVVPSCDQGEQLVALIDFPTGLPDFLSSLKTEPLKSFEVPRDDEGEDDLVFDRHFHGFTQLFDVSDDDIKADIIAICGIDGHAYGSWQGRGNTRRMWLRHFLRKDLPSCRVMTYGYNAKLATYGFATAEDYSIRLLEDLKRVRTGNAQMRPVIFVTHSFGGLILAGSIIKTFYMNETDHPALTSLHRATYGILFFAVPHRGLDVEDMSRIMGQEKHPRTGLLNHISVDSAQLRFQLGPLRDILYNCKVVSYYETEQTQRLIRTENGEWQRSGEHFTSLQKDSAVLQLPRQIETAIPMYCDHSAIVKFSNKSDDGYSSALAYLQEFVDQAPLIISQRFQSTARSPLQSPVRSHSAVAVTTQDLDVGSQDLTEDPPAQTTLQLEPAAEANEPKSSKANSLTIMHAAALNLERDGKHADAEAKFLEVLYDRQKELGPDDPDTLETYFRVGLARYQQSKLTEAFETFTQVLGSRQRVLGQDHANTLQTMHNIGLVQFMQKLYEASLATFSEVLAARTRTLGQDAVATLYTMHEIGRAYYALGQYSEARDIWFKTVEGREKTLGPDKPDTLTSKFNLGLTYHHLKSYTQAISVHTQVLADRKLLLGEDNSETLTSMHELARAHRQLLQYDQAIGLYTKCLAGRERTLGSIDPATLMTMGNLAGTYRLDNDLTKAQSMYIRYIYGRDRVYGLNHAGTLWAVHELGEVYERDGKFADAAATFARAVAAREKALGVDNEFTQKSRKAYEDLVDNHLVRRGRAWLTNRFL